MKKFITLAVTIILVMATAIPVMAAEKKEKSLSVYSQDIRENIKGEWTDCNCVGLCFCAQLYHVLEDTTEDDFYSAFFNGDYFIYSLGGIYQDCSSSMEKIFSYERLSIIKNLSPFLNENQKEIKDVFKNEKTDLYGLLSSFNNEIIGKTIITIPREAPVIITDLWDTEGAEAESFRYDGEIVFCVPYSSRNTEGVLHCEEVVNNILWNHGWIPGCMSIYVIYTDEVIVEYSNTYRNGGEGCITIYVP